MGCGCHSCATTERTPELTIDAKTANSLNLTLFESVPLDTSLSMGNGRAVGLVAGEVFACQFVCRCSLPYVGAPVKF